MRNPVGYLQCVGLGLQQEIQNKPRGDLGAVWDVVTVRGWFKSYSSFKLPYCTRGFRRAFL